jgi:hypothetical protein
MRIGTYVIWEMRLYLLRGVEPCGVPNRRAQLEYPLGQLRIWVPLEELEELEQPQQHPTPAEAGE